MLSKIDEPPNKIFLIIFLVIVLVIVLSIGRYILIERNTDDESIHSSIPISIPMVMNSALLSVVQPPLGFLEVIIRRESDWKYWVCNRKYGCKAGMGLIQVIPSTVKYCSEKLGYKIDPFNPYDNMECGIWLLDNDGTEHWEEWSGPYYF